MSTAATSWDYDGLVATWPGLTPLPGPISVDACVVGLGASGLAAIDALTERGLSVAGLDAGRVAAAAAGRNGGFLLGGPAPFLHDAIAAWGTAPAVDLYRATLAELDRLSDSLGPDLVRRTGSIRLAGLPGDSGDAAEEADRAAELADCSAHATALRAHGIKVEDYDAELGRGVYLPDDAATNPVARALTAAAALRGRAALYEQTTVTAVGPGGVDTVRGRVDAGVVIVAVDGRLERLLPQLGGRVRSARLQMLGSLPVAGLSARLPCPVYGRWGYDYAQADSGGRLVVGGGRDRTVATEWTTDDEVTGSVQSYLETIAVRFAGGPVVVDKRWGASVGYTADGRALVVEVAPGVVACGGYSGTGNLVGAVAARAAVALALDGTRPPSYFDSGPINEN